MFNYNSFMLPQNSSPLRAKPLQNFTPYFPTIQPTLDSSPHIPLPKEDPQNHDELPYNIRILLENEEELQTTSSNSEKVDKMSEVSQGFKTPLAKGWAFGQDEIIRPMSKAFQPDISVNQKMTSNVKNNMKSWPPALNGRVSIKHSYFEPLNLNLYSQSDKRAYFITIEGFQMNSFKRFFKIEKLCHSLQEKSLNGEKDIRQFLYMNLWNDWQNGQNGTENIFEPWIYAVPYTQFRLVVTINMSHAYEDPYIFDFLVDLTQFAISSKEIRTQPLEVVYTEQGNIGNLSNIANNVTLCLQVTNEKLFSKQGLRMGQDPRQKGSAGKQEIPEEWSVILKHIFIRLPLSRIDSVNSHISSPLMQNKVSTSDSFANTGSTNSQGVEQCSPQKSWSNFSPDDSPSRKSTQFKQGTPEKSTLPPGLMNNKGTPSTSNYVSSGSLFKFKGQQRPSLQLMGEKRVSEELIAKSKSRMSSDFSHQGERNSLKDLESYIKTTKSGNRRESNTSDGSAFSCFTTLSRVQQYSSTGISENEPESPRSSLNSSICGGSMAELGEEESSAKSNNDMAEEFRVEDYVGKMVEFAKTSHGSKILQKYVATADKEDLDLVVEELGEKISELMLDPHANYMIQTLVQNGSPKQRLHLLQKISPSLITIARDKKGTHSLQAIVALIDTEEEFGLIKKTLEGSVFELSMDPRANYVIQKLINTIPIDSSHFLYQPLFNNFVQMANNSFGLLVLKQMMARVEQRDTLKQKIVELTCLNFEKLIQNPFGNYAIQHIVEFYPKESHIIKSKMLTKIIPYSSQKISSNVIEKCLTVCDSQFRRRVIEEILKNGRLGDLMKNKYGNFVTLQLLATSSLIDKERLMQAIFKYANSFNGTKYKTRWLKFVEDNPLNICWNGSANVKQEGDLSKEQNKGQSSDQADTAVKDKETMESENKTKEMDIEIVEAIKKSWREITKDEKSDPSPFSSRKTAGKKHYNKREEFFTSWPEKNY
jgi:hypothetical protein